MARTVAVEPQFPATFALSLLRVRSRFRRTHPCIRDRIHSPIHLECGPESPAPDPLATGELCKFPGMRREEVGEFGRRQRRRWMDAAPNFSSSIQTPSQFSLRCYTVMREVMRWDATSEEEGRVECLNSSSGVCTYISAKASTHSPLLHLWRRRLIIRELPISRRKRKGKREEPIYSLLALPCLPAPWTFAPSTDVTLRMLSKNEIFCCILHSVLG